ncbi:hypothetical protein ACQKWADRAFT_168685 [Trichoderma austrokoningii]
MSKYNCLECSSNAVVLALPPLIPKLAFHNRRFKILPIITKRDAVSALLPIQGAKRGENRMQLHGTFIPPPRMAGSWVWSPPLQAQPPLSTSPTLPGHFQLNLATSDAELPCHECLGTSRKRSRPQRAALANEPSTRSGAPGDGSKLNELGRTGLLLHLRIHSCAQGFSFGGRARWTQNKALLCLLHAGQRIPATISNATSMRHTAGEHELMGTRLQGAVAAAYKK